MGEWVWMTKQTRYGLYSFESILALKNTYLLNGKMGDKTQAERLRIYLLNLLRTAEEKRIEALKSKAESSPSPSESKE